MDELPRFARCHFSRGSLSLRANSSLCPIPVFACLCNTVLRIRKGEFLLICSIASLARRIGLCSVFNVHRGELQIFQLDARLLVEIIDLTLDRSQLPLEIATY